MGASERIERLARRVPAAVRLAEAVSLAARVDPALLRAARLELVPDADVGAEAELWFSSLVASRAATGFVFDRAVATELRRRLAASPERLADAWAVLERAHAHVAPALRLEEELTWRALAGHPEHLLEQELARAVRALRLPDREGLALWATRALASMPERVRDTGTGQILAAEVELVEQRALAQAGGTGDTGERWDWTTRVRVLEGTAALSVRAGEHGIELGGPPTPETTTIRTRRTEPSLVEVTWMEGDARRFKLVAWSGERAVRVEGARLPVTLRVGDGGCHQIEGVDVGDWVQELERAGIRYDQLLALLRDNRRDYGGSDPLRVRRAFVLWQRQLGLEETGVPDEAFRAHVLGRPRVVVSYARDQQEQVHELVRQLREDGVEAYPESSSIGMGFHVDPRETDWVLVVGSAAYVRDWETPRATTRTLHDEAVFDRFLPVLFGDGGPALLPPPLRDRQAAHLPQDYPRLLARLKGQSERYLPLATLIHPLALRLITIRNVTHGVTHIDVGLLTRRFDKRLLRAAQDHGVGVDELAAKVEDHIRYLNEIGATLPHSLDRGRAGFVLAGQDTHTIDSLFLHLLKTTQDSSLRIRKQGSEALSVDGASEPLQRFLDNRPERESIPPDGVELVFIDVRSEPSPRVLLLTRTDEEFSAALHAYTEFSGVPLNGSMPDMFDVQFMGEATLRFARGQPGEWARTWGLAAEFRPNSIVLIGAAPWFENGGKAPGDIVVGTQVVELHANYEDATTHVPSAELVNLLVNTGRSSVPSVSEAPIVSAPHFYYHHALQDLTQRFGGFAGDIDGACAHLLTAAGSMPWVVVFGICEHPFEDAADRRQSIQNAALNAADLVIDALERRSRTEQW